MRIANFSGAWFLVACGLCAAACGGGDGATNGFSGDTLDYVEPYSAACIQTACQKQQQTCQDRTKRDCDDCRDSCLSPYSSDPVSCASICRDICSTSDCYSCSAPKDECATQGVRLAVPPLNVELRDLAAGNIVQCHPDSPSSETWVALVAHAFRHEFAEVYRCVETKGCAAFDTCDTFPFDGTIGTAICDRQRECGVPCAEALSDQETAQLVNGFESVLRPGLVEEFRRCSRETECTLATACWEALKPTVGLAEFPSQP